MCCIYLNHIRYFYAQHFIYLLYWQKTTPQGENNVQKNINSNNHKKSLKYLIRFYTIKDKFKCKGEVAVKE